MLVSDSIKIREDSTFKRTKRNVDTGTSFDNLGNLRLFSELWTSAVYLYIDLLTYALLWIAEPIFPLISKRRHQNDPEKPPETQVLSS